MSLISQNAVAKIALSPGITAEGEPKPEPEPQPAKLKPKRNKKKRSRDEQDGKKVEEDEEEMRRREVELFGPVYARPEWGSEFPDPDADSKPSDPDTLFIVDRTTENKESVYEEDRKRTRKPAWVDEDEERILVDISSVARLRKLRRHADEKVVSGAEYVKRLQAQYVKLHPEPEWARSRSEESGVTVAEGVDDDDERDILRGARELVEGTGKLLPGPLECTRLFDVNRQDRSNSVINSVQFHPVNGQLLFTAGLNKRLTFYQVDGKRNPKLDSIFLEDCPIVKAAFTPDGSEVIVAGRRKFFYIYDLMKNVVNRAGPLIGREEKSLESFEVSPDSKTIAFVGNEGHILLVSSKTKQLIGTLKMNGTVRSLAFAKNGKQLLSSGGDGKVYHWDVGTRKCINVGVDEGSLAVTSLCVSPDSSLFCTGSSSGIVNEYKMDEFLGGKRKPLKVVKNLTTEVNAMKFNFDAQILAIWSRMKSKAVRLVHVPTGTVFSNWPTGNVGQARCLDFSPNSGFLTLGNSEGNVLLYKLHHYQNA